MLAKNARIKERGQALVLIPLAILALFGIIGLIISGQPAQMNAVPEVARSLDRAGDALSSSSNSVALSTSVNLLANPNDQIPDWTLANVSAWLMAHNKLITDVRCDEDGNFGIKYNGIWYEKYGCPKDGDRKGWFTLLIEFVKMMEQIEK